MRLDDLGRQMDAAFRLSLMANVIHISAFCYRSYSLMPDFSNL
jgi:hypothetical protein